MITIKEVVENIKCIKNVEGCEIENAIIIAFEDYNVEGEDRVIVESDSRMNSFTASTNCMHSAYINNPNAEIVKFELEENKNGNYNVINVKI